MGPSLTLWPVPKLGSRLKKSPIWTTAIRTRAPTRPPPRTNKTSAWHPESGCATYLPSPFHWVGGVGNSTTLGKTQTLSEDYSDFDVKYQLFMPNYYFRRILLCGNHKFSTQAFIIHNIASFLSSYFLFNQQPTKLQQKSGLGGSVWETATHVCSPRESIVNESSKG